jgi:hypothetical protein
MARLRNQAQIAEEIGRLTSLSREDLAGRWTSIFGSPSPRGVKRGLLERACAYELQARALGGLKPSARRSLLAIATGKAGKRPPVKNALRPGTRLVREWHGIVHQVDVADKSIVWKGQTYSSLSAVATAITGSRWSGPRFFGL